MRKTGLWYDEDENYQAFNLIKKQVNFLAACQSNVTFAEKTSDLPPDLVLIHIHHDHKSHHVIEHDSKQTIFIVLQSLLLRIAQ